MEEKSEKKIITRVWVCDLADGKSKKERTRLFATEEEASFWGEEQCKGSWPTWVTYSEPVYGTVVPSPPAEVFHDYEGYIGEVFASLEDYEKFCDKKPTYWHRVPVRGGKGGSKIRWPLGKGPKDYVVTQQDFDSLLEQVEAGDASTDAWAKRAKEAEEENKILRKKMQDLDERDRVNEKFRTLVNSAFKQTTSVKEAQDRATTLNNTLIKEQEYADKLSEENKRLRKELQDLEYDKTRCDECIYHPNSEYRNYTDVPYKTPKILQDAEKLIARLVARGGHLSWLADVCSLVNLIIQHLKTHEEIWYSEQLRLDGWEEADQKRLERLEALEKKVGKLEKRNRNV